MKQTALEWLIDKLDTNLDINHSWRSRQYIDQAKEMEKEQIMDAWFDGVTNWDSEKEVEDYIKETFKSE